MKKEMMAVMIRMITISLMVTMTTTMMIMIITFKVIASLSVKVYLS